MRLPDEEEFKAWLQYPCTKSLMDLLELKREALRRGWETGSFTDYAEDATILVNVANMGTCKGYAFVTDLSYDDFLTEVDDAERKRAETTRRGSPDQAV